jgi:hypothetical protein
MLSGRFVAIKTLAMSVEPSVTIPPDYHARIIAPFWGRPDDIDAIYEIIRSVGSKIFDSHLAIQLALDCLEVTVDVAIIARRKIALFAAVAFLYRKPTATKRRVFNAPSSVMLHPRDIAEQDRHFALPQVTSSQGRSYSDHSLFGLEGFGSIDSFKPAELQGAIAGARHLVYERLCRPCSDDGP